MRLRQKDLQYVRNKINTDTGHWENRSTTHQAGHDHASTSSRWNSWTGIASQWHAEVSLVMGRRQQNLDNRHIQTQKHTQIQKSNEQMMLIKQRIKQLRFEWTHSWWMKKRRYNSSTTCTFRTDQCASRRSQSSTWCTHSNLHQLLPYMRRNRWDGHFRR